MVSGKRIQIRDATSEDVELLLRLLKQKAAFDGYRANLPSEDTLRETMFGERPMAHALLAEFDGQPVGLASYYFTFSTFSARAGIWLDDLFVQEGSRNQGIGRALLTQLARVAKTRGCERIDWTAAIVNTRAIAFYRRVGATMSDHAVLCRLYQDGIENLLSNGPLLNLDWLEARLDSEDDPELWHVALRHVLSQFVPEVDQMVEVGRCSHWLRPHQTRWKADGGFAYPIGYGENAGWVSRSSLPQFDWSVVLQWDGTTWRKARRRSVRNALRLAIPSRTRRHRQAALHALWHTGREKKVAFYGFRKKGGQWTCTAFL